MQKRRATAGTLVDAATARRSGLGSWVAAGDEVADAGDPVTVADAVPVPGWEVVLRPGERRLRADHQTADIVENRS
jgi:hypothetical protein